MENNNVRKRSRTAFLPILVLLTLVNIYTGEAINMNGEKVYLPEI